MRSISLTNTNLAQVAAAAAEVLAAGGLVIYPTETVYGAGVDATNQKAVDKLLAYKSRREGKPLSVAVTDQAMAEQFVVVNEQAKQLYQQFLPGPMTVISAVKIEIDSDTIDLNKASISDASETNNTSQPTPAKASQHTPPPILAKGVASEFGTLGIRMSDHPLVSLMVQRLGTPITATSANASGKRRPYTIAHILDHLSDKQKGLIDLIIDAGELPKRPPSTVIDTTLSTPIIFRQGALQTSGAAVSLVKQDTRTTSAQTLIQGSSLQQHTQLQSKSEQETQAIAGKLLLSTWDAVKTGPVVVGLNGPLGAGKTVFAKGVAQFLGITEPIVSPTYNYIEEYRFARHQTTGMLYHVDAWKVDDAAIFERLELNALLLPEHILIIEWFSQISEWFLPALLTKKATVIEVSIADLGETRDLLVSQYEKKQATLDPSYRHLV